ncbi:MAG: NAD(P)H-hydrate dehydratase [Thermoguttaceae bacterium]|nr:NAD(P)H-hydrate dehydratase [Thermoguttaceae bacterium]
METYLPDAATRQAWRKRAQEESQSARRAFWRSTPELPSRPADAHKGTFGTALAIGGSRGMSGAIALSGMSSLVSGAGLARVAVPSAIQETVAQFGREYTTIACPSDAEGRFGDEALEPLLAESSRATAVAIGPGLGRSETLDWLVTELFFELERPAVFDADALNALASSGVFHEGDPRYRGRFPKGDRVLTPHPGEFERLAGVKPTRVAALRRETSFQWLRDWAGRFYGESSGVARSNRLPATLLLKGSGTVVSSLTFPKVGGHKIKQTVNQTGNANLATGGSGDVLTGIIAGLMAQGMTIGDAARAGAALHGVAAELRATIVSRGAVAGDVIRFLPAAFDYYEHARSACR